MTALVGKQELMWDGGGPLAADAEGVGEGKGEGGFGWEGGKLLEELAEGIWTAG